MSPPTGWLTSHDEENKSFPWHGGWPAFSDGVIRWSFLNNKCTILFIVAHFHFFRHTLCKINYIVKT